MALKLAQSIAPQLSEDLLVSALALYFDWARNQCFPRVSMWTWEQDFVVVTEAGRVWEVEIKLTRADWKADASKDKWETQSWKKIARFYYCVPTELIAKGVPDWVPDYAGILVLEKKFFKPTKYSVGGDKITISEHRPAKNRSKYALASHMLMRLYRSTYFRFWRSGRIDPQKLPYVPVEVEGTSEIPCTAK